MDADINKIFAQLKLAEKHQLVEHWSHNFDYNNRQTTFNIVVLESTNDAQIQKLKDILTYKYGAHIRDDNYFYALKYFGDSHTCAMHSKRLITFTVWG